MKKLVLPLVLLSGLLAAYFLFFRKSREGDNIFHVPDPTAIGRIELETIIKGQSAKTLTLKRQTDNSWQVNDRYTALQPKVENFLTYLGALRVYQPIADKGQETSLGLLKRNHTRVLIEDRDGKELIHYLVGPPDSPQKSNIMMREDADRAYLVNRPGHEGYVSILYSVNENDWRERLIWNLEADQLAEISIQYPDSTASFTLSREALGAPWQLGSGQPANAQADAYTAQFKGKVFAESFADIAYPGIIDSLQRRQPDIRFHYRKLDQQHGSLLLFIRPENINNLFGYLEGGKEAYTIQHHVIDPFLPPRAYFLPKGS
jgi:Domain of unknown function (DUF4340)